MTSGRHRQIMDVLADALDRAPADRPAFLDRACGADLELRHAVDTLLARQDCAAEFLESPLPNAHAHVQLSADDSLFGQRLGPYCIEDEIGRGGMGAVYSARRADDEFEQRVAIKLIKRGMDTDAIQRRFRSERQILANLNHPYIARLYDGGTTHDGLPYLVMERVIGERVDQYADRHHMDGDARVTVFLKICDAVQHAHDHLIVHGDLKPANILVTSDGTPKLLDFGIARIVNPSSRSADAPTGGWRVMTPEYASPEQLRGEPINMVSDVYSLGAVLAELLRWRPAGMPLAKPRRRSTSADLETIVATALNLDLSRRYSSVRLLADDLRRYLEGRPIQARKDTAAYRTRAFFRRHTRAVAASAAVALCSLFLGAGFTWVAIRSAPTISLAVLPFAASTTDQATAVLSEGITDSLINHFGHIGSLTIPARDSILRFRNLTGAPGDAARALKVGSILTGTVTTAADRLIVDVALFDERRDTRVWTYRYEVAASDVLSLEERIVRDAALELGVLPGAAAEPVSRRNTQNSSAYRQYILGRYLWNFRTLDGFTSAIPHFQAAIAEDPRYALAYSGLADCYGLMGAYFQKAPQEVFPAAKRAALQAVAIDDGLAEAHTSLALTAWLYDWDWAKTDQEFRRAIAADNRYVTAHHWYGLFLGEMGRSAEAVAEMQRAAELDPLSAPVYGDLGRVFFWARQYDKSRDAYRQAFEMGANDNFRVEALELYEQTDPAEYVLTQERLNLEPKHLDILRARGQVAYWQQLLIDRVGVPADVYYAMANLRVGRTDEAFKMLDIAFANRDHRLSQLKVSPIFDSIRNDPRFRNLLRRMNLG